MKHFYLIICCVVFSLAVSLSPVTGQDFLEGDILEEDAVIPVEAGIAEKEIVLEVPLDSPHFADTPVALVNDEPILLRELAKSVAATSAQAAEDSPERHENTEYLKILNRLVNIRLIVQEARNIGLDETPEVQAKIREYKLKLLLKKLVRNHLEGLEPDPAEVDELYRQLSREVQLYTLKFKLPADANAFRAELETGDFKELAAKYIEEGKAEGELAEEYVKIKDMLPQVGQQVYSMEKGDVSITFSTDDSYLLFQLEDSRFVEDPGVREEAYDIVMDSFRKGKAMEYTQTLDEKYVDFNDELYEQLDFETGLKEYAGDKRVLATVKGEEPAVITVGDLVSKVKVGFFHGAEKAESLQIMNKRKEIALANMLFRLTGELEAKNQGLDQTEEYMQQVEDFERSTLFSAFMNKVILPDVNLTGEEVRAYYDEHLEEFSSPVMLRMNSLVFEEREKAEDALDKLRKGADFKWVSANVTGFVDQDAEGVLPFDRKLMSLTALPEDLQGNLEGVTKGDALLYAPAEEEYFYVLRMEEVFQPEAQPYMQARDEAAKIVFNQKSEKLVDEWTTKLREAYSTEIFLQQAGE
jgi:hypothetical protein